MAPRNNDANNTFGKKKNYPPEECDSETEIQNIVPCLLHKKHKVVKAVKSQLKKIQEEGFSLDFSEKDADGADAEDKKRSPGGSPKRYDRQKSNQPEGRSSKLMSFGEDTVYSDQTSQPTFSENSSQGIKSRRSDSEGASRGIAETEAGRGETESGKSNVTMCCYLFAFLIALFFLLLLMVWISAGPLSNLTPHTPISGSFFVRTDAPCTLEKKYLLRWSQPEYFE